MPIVLIPIHFDRSNIERTTSFQRSVVIRPFITQDFMTGVPAIPGKDISVEVRINLGSNQYHVHFSCNDLTMSLMITLFQEVYLLGTGDNEDGVRNLDSTWDLTCPLRSYAKTSWNNRMGIDTQMVNPTKAARRNQMSSSYLKHRNKYSITCPGEDID